MKYINLNRLLTAGAAALLLSLPMTACSKSDSQNSSEVQQTEDSSAAEETTETSASDASAEKTGATGTQPSDAPSDSTYSSEASVSTADSSGTDDTDKPDPTAMTVYGDALTASAGEKHVAVPVKIRNNTGYSMIGITLHYDTALNCVTTETLLAECTPGEAASGLNVKCYVNQQAGSIGMGGIHAGSLTADGILFTCYFDVPEDAKAGTTYQFSPKINSMSNESGLLTCETEDFTLTVQ
ncbi:MAG: hypothetical protein J6Z45_06255 [Oscillospiraceae bacterium]|nr:hypothetical protein [Oscillospiraceae bacterium]